MLKIGDYVFVGTKGVCEIENIKKNAFFGADKTKEYYVLKPIKTSTNMVVFLPTDTSVKIRPLVPARIAEDVLNNFKTIEPLSDVSEEKRIKFYEDIMKNGEFEDRVKLFKLLLKRKYTISKKVFGAQEQKYLTNVSDCVLGEIAFVLKQDIETIKNKIILTETDSCES